MHNEKRKEEQMQAAVDNDLRAINRRHGDTQQRTMVCQSVNSRHIDVDRRANRELVWLSLSKCLLWLSTGACSGRF